jgi:hypothetical protein
MFLNVKKRMVCLYGLALQGSTEKNVTSEYWNEHAPWNWLVNDLTYFVYKKSGLAGCPYIPISNETDWGEWFYKVSETLKREFYDAHKPELIFRILENCPTEEVAIMIFETLEIETIKEFLLTCPHGAG